ncbi:MAG: hypothetical protein ACJ72E_08255 [Marmoricola sp.]
MTPPVRGGACAVVLAALVLLAAGCGKDQEQTYCDALHAKQTIFADDDSGQGFLPHLADLRALAKKAPDDLTDEWQVFLDALGDLSTAISSAGVKASDIVGGKQPAGVSDAQWAAIRAAANGLGSDSVAEALDGIDQEARDVCQLQLGL